MANDFKPFATGPGANVTPQNEWGGLPALRGGFQAGKASSAQINKVLRQASFIAAALAQYTADKSGEDVLDDGDVAGFIAKMADAFGEDFQPKNANLAALAGLPGAANRLPYFTGANALALTALTAAGRELIGKNDVPAILEYLGLGDGGFVSANGGEYDKTFKFGRVEIIPNESNGAALYSADGSLPENSIVSGVEFHWFGHQFNIGIMRDAAEGTVGLAIQYNGRSVAAVNPAGDLIAERGVFESQGQVRVYSPNNPPPGPQGVRLGARTQLSPNTLYDGFVVVDYQASSGVTGMGGRPLQTLVGGNWVTVGVV